MFAMSTKQFLGKKKRKKSINRELQVPRRTLINDEQYE